MYKRQYSYSVRYKYKDHSGKPCEGWESFKTKKAAQELRTYDIEKFYEMCIRDSVQALRG